MSIRAKLLARKDRQIRKLHEVEEGEHVVFIMPPERALMDLQERREKGVLTIPDYEVALLMRCVREPTVGEDGAPLKGEDGMPLFGKPVFDRTDEEALRSDEHQIGGWLRQLKDALATFIAEGSRELLRGTTEGNPASE